MTTLLAVLTAIAFGGTAVSLVVDDDEEAGEEPATVTTATTTPIVTIATSPTAPSPTAPPASAATRPPPSTGPPRSTGPPAVSPIPTVESTAPTTSPPPPPPPAPIRAPMRVTIDIHPHAVWDDGSPVTAADFRCTWLAHVHTAAALNPAGYEQIRSVRAGRNARRVVVTFSARYAGYRDLFDGIIKAAAVADCRDVSGELETSISFSAGPYRVEAWGPDRAVLVANPRYWGSPAKTGHVVLVAVPDPGAELDALRQAQVDLVSPPFVGFAEEQFEDPNTEVVRSYSGDYEALYLQQRDGPFADRVFREAFWKSIDVDALYDTVYAPLAAGRPRLTCGPIVSRRYCPRRAFRDTFDPDGAAAALSEAGWVKDGDGFWAKDGVVPDIRWMVTTGNARREASQAYLIPILAQAGFRVVADNCTADCVFDQRLPALDYELTTYASFAPPDPGFLAVAFSCDNVPSIENDFRGQNQQGWCNPEASMLLAKANTTLNVDERAATVKAAIRLMAVDHVLLPLFEIPQITAIRTDRLGGVIGEHQLGYGAFDDFREWSDLDGDGEIVIGMDQLPVCLNPVTECAASRWYQRAIATPLLPSVWDVTSKGGYRVTELVVGEPSVLVGADE